MSLDCLIGKVTSFKIKIADSYSNLAPSFRFDYDDMTLKDKILELIRSRFVELYKLLYRPLIHRAIHAPLGDASQEILKKLCR